MDENQQQSEEKRRLTTVFDPKVVQLLIPLMLAVGSGFLFHDRAISTLQTQQDQHKQTITTYATEQTKAALTIRDLQKDVENLKARATAAELRDEQVLIALNDLQQRVATLAQDQKYSKEDLREIKDRLTDIERKLRGA